MYRQLTAPITCQIELTAACNHNCVHCYNFWRREDRKTFISMTPDEIRHVIKLLSNARVFDLVFTGGEPLMAYDTLKAGVLAAKEANMGFSINSNLVPITRTHARELNTIGVHGIMTSILGPRAEVHDALVQSKGSFDRLIRNILLLQSEGIRVSANMVVSKANLPHIKATAHLLKDLGVNKLNITRVTCPGSCTDFSSFSLNPQEYRQYLSDVLYVHDELGMQTDALVSSPLCGIAQLESFHFLVGNRRCSAGVSSITISTIGQVRPCPQLDIEYGNIFQDDLHVIWARMACYRDGTILPTECKKCALFAVCGGGCRMEAKMRNGGLAQLDPIANVSAIPETLISWKQLKHHPKFSRRPVSSPFLVSSYRMRAEDFGACVMVGRSSILLNQDGLKVLNQFTVGRTYSPDSEEIDWGPVDREKLLSRFTEVGLLVPQ